MALERRAGTKRIQGDKIGRSTMLQPRRKVVDDPSQKARSFNAPAPEVVSRFCSAIRQIRRVRKQEVARPINGLEKIAEDELNIPFPVQYRIKPCELERPRIDI